LVHTDHRVGLVRPDASKVETLIEDCGNRFGESVHGLAPFTTSKTTSDHCDVAYDDFAFYYDQRLFVIDAKDYTLTEITPLLSYFDMAQDAATMVDVPVDLLYASVANAWSVPAVSPDGRTLAFTAAIDGPSADLYLYDFEFGEITRKSSGANQALDPIWSPDSSGVLHYEYVFAPSCCDRFLNAPVALWWAPVSDDPLVKMSEGEYPRFWGWLDSNRFVIWHSDLSGPLGIGDISTGETAYILDRASMAATLQTTDSGAVLAAVPEETIPDRLVLIDGRTGLTEDLPLQLNASSLAIRASETLDRFLLASYQLGFASISTNGQVVVLDETIQPTQIVLSPDGLKAVVGASKMDPQWLFVFGENGGLTGRYSLPDHILSWRSQSWRPDSEVYIIDCGEIQTQYVRQPDWEVHTTSLSCPLWHHQQAVLWSE
jgi:hypothetical protein